jgi:ubiquinone/menaquinone biosynthesis C-methylase UbiE
MLAEARRQFLEDYAHIRSAEGRGSQESAYYRALPFRDLSGRNSVQWRMRTRTFQYLAHAILPQHSARVLDLGAGNCWLSYRLAELRHRPVAVDIFSDARDGLRAAQHYPQAFPLVEGDFDRLPFAAGSFDLVLFNASFHYSPDYRRTLAEVRRCLAPAGRVVILDSPMYKLPEHGERMRAERQKFFQQQHGLRSEALGSVEFLHEAMLDDLARELRLTWRIHHPWYGLGWMLRPWKAKLLGRRPPSRFWILEAAFQAHG